MKPATRIAVVLFSIVALAHLLRLIYGWELTVDGWAVPMWASVIAVVVPATLAFLIVREHKA